MTGLGAPGDALTSVAPPRPAHSRRRRPARCPAFRACAARPGTLGTDRLALQPTRESAGAKSRRARLRCMDRTSRQPGVRRGREGFRALTWTAAQLRPARLAPLLRPLVRPHAGDPAEQGHTHEHRKQQVQRQLGTSQHSRGTGTGEALKGGAVALLAVAVRLVRRYPPIHGRPFRYRSIAPTRMGW